MVREHNATLACLARFFSRAAAAYVGLLLHHNCCAGAVASPRRLCAARCGGGWGDVARPSLRTLLWLLALLSLWITLLRACLRPAGWQTSRPLRGSRRRPLAPSPLL
jgi:hypothetical protein